MAKSRKHMHKKRKGRRVKRTKRFMRGGDFSEQELAVLHNTGFNQYQIQRFKDMGLTFDQVNQKIQEIRGNDFHGNSDDFADEVEQALFNEHMDQGIPHAHYDDHTMDMDVDLDESFGSDNHSQGSLHMSDLDASQHSDASGYTTNEDESFEVGGRRRTMKKRKGRKTRKTGKTNGRKTRRQRGGTCYGNGVGANNYDPSWSIYNTRELTLFPYKPTN